MNPQKTTSIWIFLILFFLAGFRIIALFIDSTKEKGNPRNPDFSLIIISAIASIVITFLAAYFFDFKLVGGGAFLGAAILFSVYGLLYKLLS